MAQFASAMNNAIYQYGEIPEGKPLSHSKNFSKIKILAGIQQTVNPDTIAMASFNTFLFLFARISTASAGCSLGNFCDLSLKTMMV